MGNAGNLIRRRKNFVRVNAMSFGLLIKDLQLGVYSQQELADNCGLAIQTVRLYVKTLHKIKAVYIADWAEDKRGGRTIRIFALGDKPDAPKPPPKSPLLACAHYRAKKKQMKMLQAIAGVA